MPNPHATETITAQLLTPGRTLLVPMTEGIETVSDISITAGYVTVATVEGSRFQWPAGFDVDVVTNG